MSTLPIELTAMEVLLLTDRVQNADREDGHEIAKPLLIKLGSAYIEMIGEKPKDGTVTIHLTEPETWLARSKFNSGDRCDADPKLGIHLLLKLYRMLLQFDAAIDLPDADVGHDLTHKQATKQIDWGPEPTGGKR
jgi:hypothetical protein